MRRFGAEASAVVETWQNKTRPGFFGLGLASGVIKHGWLENGPFVSDFLLKPPFVVDFPFRRFL